MSLITPIDSPHLALIDSFAPEPDRVQALYGQNLLATTVGIFVSLVSDTLARNTAVLT